MQKSTRVTIAAAAWRIGDEDHPIAPSVILRAGKRLGLVEHDEHGRNTLPVQVVEVFRRNYHQFGLLHRRGQRTLEGIAG
jgi:hypothetical protein